MFIDGSCLQLHSNIRFMGRSVEFVNSVDLLGAPLYDYDYDYEISLFGHRRKKTNTKVS